MDYKVLSSGVFNIDFRTKLFLTVVLSYVLMLGNLEDKYVGVAAFATLLPYVFFVLSKEYRTAIKGFIFTSIALLIRVFLIEGSSGIIHSAFLFMSMIFLRMLPGIMMGKYMIVTSEIGEIAYCMKRMRFPDYLIIPLTVMSRFFCTVKEDYGQIKDAMKIHGLCGPKMILRPVRLIEYRIVPLLMIITKTADDVAVSAMTRGMVMGEKRTYFRNSRLRIRDYICLSMGGTLILFYLMGKYYNS